MPTIRQLSPRVVNKIAAGEVIERPASVVKELMENSVDAGASRVDVIVTQGGTQTVTVSDNGCGIPIKQLLLAVTCHATSKLEDADDLFHVGTLGFRGEALASIAEVSQFTIRSRVADCQEGGLLQVDGGELQNTAPCGCPPGTRISVENLFFNTPVRRKFLRKQQTEMGHCTEAFTRIALAFPEIHFTLQHNDRQLFDLPPVTYWRERIIALFGAEFADILIDVSEKMDDINLHGFVAAPSQSRSNNRMQYLLLNGRFIRDRSLQHALGEAYRGLLMVGRYPIGFLRIEMPPEQIDVNVHPTKMEVRFQDGGRLYSQLLSTLRNRFLTSDLTHSLEGSSPRARLPGHPISDPAKANAFSERNPASHIQDERTVELPSLFSTRQADRPMLSPERPTQPPVTSQATASSLETGNLPMHLGSPDGIRDTVTPISRDTTGDAVGQPTDRLPEIPRSAIQVHNCYLVTETEDGVIVIDQHALHERIIYEQLRTKVLAGKVETQKLLVPEPVELRPTEAAAVLDSQETLAEMGIEVSDFGGNTVLVVGYPAMLANLNPAELLRQIVESLMSEGREKSAGSETRGPQRRDILDSLLHMISCKAAVKSGDHLSTEEITALIEQRQLVQDSHHCPHGRPTALVLSKEELDRKFGRT